MQFAQQFSCTQVSQMRGIREHTERLLRDATTEVLRDADVVACTLTGAGKDVCFQCIYHIPSYAHATLYDIHYLELQMGDGRSYMPRSVT